jgi:hypothetical protein
LLPGVAVPGNCSVSGAQQATIEESQVRSLQKENDLIVSCLLHATELIGRGFGLPREAHLRA